MPVPREKHTISSLAIWRGPSAFELAIFYYLSRIKCIVCKSCAATQEFKTYIKMSKTIALSSSVDIVTYALNSPEKYDENKPLYIDADNPEKYLTAAQTRRLTRKLVAGLTSYAGIQPGDRIVVHLPSTHFFSSIVFAIIGSQGVYVASNPSYKEFELKHLLEYAQPAVLITSKDLLPVVENAVREKNIALSSVYVLDTVSFDVRTHVNSGTTNTTNVDVGTSTKNGPRPFEKLLECGETDWHRLETMDQLQRTPAAIFSTSGTTGRRSSVIIAIPFTNEAGLPKLAVVTHLTVVAEFEAVFSVCPRNVVRLISLPLFLKYGFLYGHVPAMRCGAPVYILPRFKLDAFLQTVQTFGIEEITVVPAMVSAMLRTCELDALKAAFDSVRYVSIGGSALDDNLFAAFQGILHADVVISHGWGTTETGPLAVTRGEGRADIGTVGPPFPGTTIKLLDEDGTIVVKDGVPGTAWAKSAFAFSGYRNPDGTLLKPFDDEGWFETGDIMTWRGKSLCFVGRSKELIKVNR